MCLLCVFFGKTEKRICKAVLVKGLLAVNSARTIQWEVIASHESEQLLPVFVFL